MESVEMLPERRTKGMREGEKNEGARRGRERELHGMEGRERELHGWEDTCDLYCIFTLGNFIFYGKGSNHRCFPCGWEIFSHGDFPCSSIYGWAKIIVLSMWKGVRRWEEL